MPSRQGRTTNRRRRDREKFWRDHADSVRVIVIGAGAVVVVSFLAQMMLS